MKLTVDERRRKLSGARWWSGGKKGGKTRNTEIKNSSSGISCITSLNLLIPRKFPKKLARRLRVLDLNVRARRYESGAERSTPEGPFVSERCSRQTLLSPSFSFNIHLLAFPSFLPFKLSFISSSFSPSLSLLKWLPLSLELPSGWV